MIKQVLTAGALAAFATTASAQTMPGQALVILDPDGNAIVTYEEFVEQMNAIFGEMDSSGNGRVEFKEVEGTIDRDLFDGADTNGDGVLTRQEFGDQMRKDFEAADKDGDGVLD